MSLIIEIGRSMFFEVLQVILGCLIAYGLYGALAGKSGITGELNKEIVLAAILSSLAGIVIPTGIFGVAPIVLALFMVGIRFSILVPMLASNFIFNMLVPFTEVGFKWQTSMLRVAAAFIIGFAAGMLSDFLKFDARRILKEDPSGSKESPESLMAFINRYISKAGLFLIIGVILEVIFKEYLFYDLVNVFNISSMAAAVFGFIQGYDITTPVFILNMIIFNLVMNLTTLSGVLMLFRWKSAIGYYVYFAFWVFVICIVNIFVF